MTQIKIIAQVQITELLIMQFSPIPCYLVFLMAKYLPQYPILEPSQTVFFPQCARPSLTPIRNIRQSYSSVYLNLYVLR
jgi:hypothetical protein